MVLQHSPISVHFRTKNQMTVSQKVAIKNVYKICYWSWFSSFQL